MKVLVPVKRVVDFNVKVRVKGDGSGVELSNVKMSMNPFDEIDDDSNQTGQMLAALLGWSQATFASKLEVDGADFKVTREVDGGLQTVKLKGPAIVTTDLRLNEPRYASLPNIMKAKKKPIADKSASDYGVDLTAHLEILKTSEPPGRKGGVKVKDVAELVSKLKNEAGVL